MSNIYSLDIETRSLTNNLLFALEPFRVIQRKAEITSIAVCYPNDKVVQIVNTGPNWKDKVRSLLKDLKNQVVYAHNTLFDVAFLLATLEPSKTARIPNEIRDIRWRDTMLLTKWLVNGQKAEDLKFSYSLKNLCKVFLKSHPRLDEFTKVKEQDVIAGENTQYWLERGRLDAIMTRALAEKLQNHLPEEQRQGLLTEFSCIVPVANSWLRGIRIDVNEIEKVESTIKSKMDEMTSALDINENVLNSPKRLSKLLFTDWSLTPININKTGPSTARADLMWIHYNLLKRGSSVADKMECIMTFKKYSTLQSKYVKTLKEALSHTGDNYIYGSPKLYGTYTGRLTYSNNTKGSKTSIALHQLPRAKFTKIADVSEVVKKIRGLLIPHEGYGVIEFDASGQESRLIALRSNDETLLKVFRDGLNFHSMTGAAIVGMDYEKFHELYEQESKTGFGYYVEQRQLGKLTNLSCNYRIGGRALAEKAFTTYETFMDEATGWHLVKTFKRQYPGIVKYWDDAIEFAKAFGYTSSFGGRRYKIHKWDGKNTWISESSALNFPIQGSGADMKEIAISEIYRHFPEAQFALDLHDGLFYFVKLNELKSTEVLKHLNRINYKSYWDVDLKCPLSFEMVMGKSFKDLK